MRIVLADRSTVGPLRLAAGQANTRSALAVGRFVPHPVDDRAPLRVYGAAPSLGILRHGLDGVDRRLGGLELLTLLDDGTGFLQASAQLLGARIDRLQLDPARRPAPDRSPECGDRHGDSSQERNAAI